MGGSTSCDAGSVTGSGTSDDAGTVILVVL